MMTAILATAAPTPADFDELADFCQELFCSIPRSDQRRWGEVYVRGLLTVPGRKTIRSIADHVVGTPVDQCLQQFINQSTWAWEPVRRTMVHLAAAIRPQALTIQEAVFPKNGTSSVGVDRQFAASAGRVLNCQLGIATILAGRDGGCAVNWRLMLPRSWDDDPRRRTRSRVPDRERHLPRWQHILDSVDETVRWSSRPAPVVLDTCDGAEQELLRGLSERGLPYVIGISTTTPVLRSTAHGRVLTAAELAARSVKRPIMLTGQGTGRQSLAQYSVATVCDPCLTKGAAPIPPVCTHTRTRRLLVEWAPGDGGLRAAWLTNLRGACLHELVGLVNVGARARHEVLARLRTDFGLQDFEGRSFPGWHRHVTLVSAAHTHWTLRRMRQRNTRMSTVDIRSLRRA